jgi:uncharacterized protein DUF5318
MYRSDTCGYYVPVRPRSSTGRKYWVQAALGFPWSERPYRRTRANPGSAHARFRRTLADMTSRRSVVDYGLARRATLASVRSGHTTVADVCDAHPYLLRAAKFHGEPTEVRCPICRKAKLTHVTYVYGDELGQYEGRVKQTRELAEMAAEYGEFRVYVVEVCQSCGWNHLATSYVLGTGEPAVRRRRRARTSQLSQLVTQR